jgi:N utilization substance protein B
MRSPKDPRHIARIISVMDLYKHFFPEVDLAAFDTDDLEIGNFSKKIHEGIILGVKDNYSQIDKLIDEYSNPVKSVDLDNLILQIIRIAVYEGFIGKTVPPKVAVDEAIELARDFGLELSAKKVGGILGKIFENVVGKENEVKG